MEATQGIWRECLTEPWLEARHPLTRRFEVFQQQQESVDVSCVYCIAIHSLVEGIV